MSTCVFGVRACRGGRECMYAGTRLRVCPCVHVCPRVIHVYRHVHMCIVQYLCASIACVCVCALCAHCACLSRCVHVCTCVHVSPRMCTCPCVCQCVCTQEWTCVLCARVYTPVHGCAGKSRSENPILTHVQLHKTRAVCTWPPPCLRHASHPCFRLGDRGPPVRQGRWTSLSVPM